MHDRKNLNLQLYLVTDSTPAILGEKDLCQVVEEAIRGGVTIVQYRDKHAETGELVKTASKLLAVCQRNEVPLLINDRVDVAIAVGADGVHLGQDDLPIAMARKMLGEQAIIGISASSVEEAKEAQKNNADYLGIGAVFATSTKANSKAVLGTAQAATILQSLAQPRCPAVAIGGITASNIQNVISQISAGADGPLEGVAIVSAIIAAEAPKSAAASLLMLSDNARGRIEWQHKLDNERKDVQFTSQDLQQVLDQVPDMIREHSKKNPLCHNMTNLVVQNIAANVCLATGSSPIMANDGNEAEDLSKLNGGLVINMGSVTPESLSNYILALSAYNKAGNPVLFDPVGAGATKLRRDAVKRLMCNGHFDVIKGNEGEIKTVYDDTGAGQKGVDSGPSSMTDHERASLVEALAEREVSIVLMTGATDFLSDGARTVAIRNGHPLLGEITGSGCCLGSTIASYVAACRQDKFAAALAAVLHYEIAAERATKRVDGMGPGSFVPAFLDSLYHIRKAVVADRNNSIQHEAKVSIISV